MIRLYTGSDSTHLAGASTIERACLLPTYRQVLEAAVAERIPPLLVLHILLLSFLVLVVTAVPNGRHHLVVLPGVRYVLDDDLRVEVETNSCVSKTDIF